MNFFDKLQHLDRRYIYLVVALAIIVPFLIPFNQRTYTTEPVENIYQLLDSYAGSEDKALLMVFSHDAGTMPELFPMEVAMLRHCFLRDIKVFTLCFTPTAEPIMTMAIEKVKEEFNDIESGVDYCNFGYKPYALYMPIVLGMGDNIADAVETDAEGRNIAELPIMKDITNYNEMNFIIEFSASSAGYMWFTFARARYGANVAAGITAVMAADQYPYIQTGQLVGILGGLKGAAEYEELVDVFAGHQNAAGEPAPRLFSKDIATDSEEAIDITDPAVLYKFKKARLGMNAQTVAHIMIIVFITLGNIGYFLQRRREKKMD